LPFSDEPTSPLLLYLKKDTTVEDAIGYILYEYQNEKRKPDLPQKSFNVQRWNLRMVDDGEIDYDFPGIVTLLVIYI
jgi:hypothetical protein